MGVDFSPQALLTPYPLPSFFRRYNYRSFGHWGNLGGCCDGRCCEPQFYAANYDKRELAIYDIFKKHKRGETPRNPRYNCQFCYAAEDFLWHTKPPPPMHLVPRASVSPTECKDAVPNMISSHRRTTTNTSLPSL